MPVQCSVCLAPDTDTDWSVLLSCGHCFHTVCLQQALEYRRRCPNCRVEVPKSRSNTQPFRKVFFQHSEEGGKGDDSSGGSGGGGEGGVDVSAGQLQMQLLVKEQRLQQMGIEARESAERIQKLEEEVQLAQRSLRKKEEKLASTILELTTLSKQNKAAQNELANVRVELKAEQTVAARYKLAMGTDLVGGTLDRELRQLVEQDVQVPSWFKGMLEVRNKQISEVTNRLQQLERQNQQAEGHLRHEIDRLQKQVAKLKQQLDSHGRHQAPAAAVPGPAFRPVAGRAPSFLPRPAGTGGICSRGGLGTVELGVGLQDGLFGEPELDYIPAPRAAKSGGSKPSLRQRMERLAGKATGVGSASMTASAAADTSLYHPPAQQQRQLGGKYPLVRQEVGGAHPSGQEAAGCSGGSGMAEEGADQGGFVVLEDSEDQEGEEAQQAALGCVNGNPAGAGGGKKCAEEETLGAFSEVESEDEVELVDEDEDMGGQAGPGPPQQCGGAEPALHLPAAALGGLLGKRRSPENDRHQQGHPPPPAQQQQQQPGQLCNSWHEAMKSSGGTAQGEGTTALRPSNRAGYAPIPMKAGPPGKHLGSGPGPSFLRDPQRATTGLDAQAKYIHRGPDGKGGLVSVYKNGGGDAKPLQQPGASKQRQKGKAAGAAKQAHGGMTIDLFFGRANK